MKPLTTVTALCLGLSLAACTPPPSATVTSAGGPDMAAAQAERYDGPKARIAVADFEDKMSTTGYYRAEYGRGLSDILTTTLFQTDRFIVVEREKLQAVLAEQDLGASGRMREETAAAIGDLEGAELMVTASITGFDPGQSGADAALKRVPYAGSYLGAIAGSFRTARVAMDLRVLDTRTGRVVAATSVEGKASGFSGDGSLAGVSLGGALGGFAKTPMESAIREMIRKAVDFVVSRTPPTYYRHEV